MNSENNSSNHFHVVIASDSLGLPRPWNQKNVEDQPESFFKFEMTYPFLLRTHLESMLPSRRVTVSHSAVRASSIGRVANLGSDLFQWMGADAVVIHAGVVDVWIRENETPKVTPEQFERHIGEILEARAAAGGTTPLIVFGILPTNRRMLEKFPGQNDLILKYNEIFRSRLVGDGVVFIDVERDYITELGDIIHEDGHHLSRRGHEIYAERMAEEIARLAQLPHPMKALEPLPETARAAISRLDAACAAKPINKEAVREVAAELLEAHPGHIQVRERVALARQKLGDMEEALEAIYGLARLQPYNALLWSRTALAAFAALEPEAALPYLERAYGLDPKNRSVAFRLGRTLESLGARPSALVVYESFLAHTDDDQIADLVAKLRARLEKKRA